MQIAKPNKDNDLFLPLVAKVGGDPIIAGTVNFYLIRKLDKKWLKPDLTWQDTEIAAGSGTHVADGLWNIIIPASAWTKNETYRVYAKDSGDLHIPTSEEVECRKSTAFSLISNGYPVSSLINLG